MHLTLQLSFHGLEIPLSFVCNTRSRYNVSLFFITESIRNSMQSGDAFWSQWYGRSLLWFLGDLWVTYYYDYLIPGIFEINIYSGTIDFLSYLICGGNRHVDKSRIPLNIVLKWNCVDIDGPNSPPPPFLPFCNIVNHWNSDSFSTLIYFSVEPAW